MPNGTAFSANTPNFAGAIYLRGNAEAPLLARMGGVRKLTKSHRFVVGQSYTLPDAKIPDVSPAASMSAPTPTYVTRAQDYNVTQIFHESVSVSYEKESNMGELSGINVAGQQANPASELDFQLDAKTKIIRNDIENTFVNGVYQESSNENTSNKTRGLVEAIHTNVLDIGGHELSMWDIADALVAIREAGGVTTGLVLWADTITKFQLCAEAKANNVTPQDALDPVSGINVTTLVTPAGTIRIVEGRYLPTGTALLLNLSVIAPVEQMTPGKGNFFYEELGRVGAGVQGQIFGQVGLDYGAEFYHAKLTNIKDSYTRPHRGIAVYASNVIPTTDVLPQISSVVLDTPQVGEDLSYTASYTGDPTSDPTLTAKLYIGNNPIGAYTEQEATDVTEAMVGKYAKVEVTASGTATGTVMSNAKKVIAAAAEDDSNT